MRIVKYFPLLIVLSLLVPLCACVCGGGDKVSIEMMRKAPVDCTSFSYWKVKTMGTDDLLLDIYDKFKESSEMTQLGELGIKRSDIKYAGRASGFGQATVTVLSGELDIEVITSELDGREDYETDHHQEATIWTPEDTETNKSIAIRDNIIMMGKNDDIIACIDAIALKGNLSLNDDDNITSVTDRLPDGILIQVNKAGSDPEEDYEDLIAYGKSYAKDGDEEIKVTAVYMFEDYSAAGTDAQDDIIAYLGNKGFRETEVKRFDEIYLRATAKIYTNDFVDILTW